MSQPNQLSSGITYEPLPLTNEEHAPETLYNPPQSPGPRGTGFPTAEGFHSTPQFDPNDMTPDDLPIGAAMPRFLGAALYDDGGPRARDSYASSHNTFRSAGSDFGASSVYALNDANDAGVSRYRDDPGDSYFAGEPGGVPMASVGPSSRYLGEKNAAYAAPRAKSRRKAIILGVIGGIILLIIAVVIPLYFAVIKSHHSSGSSSASGSVSHSAAQPSSTGKSGTPKVTVKTGGDGSTVTMDDGTTFTYSNPFGGYWYWDEQDPYNNAARAQSWSPALNETFNYGVDRIRGVNLGGWLNTEPFMQVFAPALFEPYLNNTTPAVDEWTLSLAMAADTANGGLSQLENHYKTFITEQDFAQIAGAGLNYVRIPLPYWAIETRGNEPFLAKTSWTYFLKAIQWARKYGLRINLDLHALPGSQNGWNHSGRVGTIGVLNGPMGLANAQRSLDYIRILAEFISQPQYSSVVTMFGITNEPQATLVGPDQLQRYYLQAYNAVRLAGGTGQGNGPFVSFHDGFLPRTQWAGFLGNADRLALDSHPYLCFNQQSSADMSTYASTPCSTWGAAVNASMSAFGMTTAGEFSNAVTDCGLWVNGVNLGTRYDGTYKDGNVWPVVGSCTPWTDWQNYDQQMKTSIQNFALASMDALQNFFFWNWKIGNSSITGKVESPAWSYQLGLEQGWMPTDPRVADGTCQNANPWVGPLQPWQTGGSPVGSVAPSISSALAWPPTAISNAPAVTLLPTYTPTGPIPTLPGPTFTSATATPSATNGWENPQDTTGLMVNISSCSYLDPWVNPTVAPPSPLCSAGTRKRSDSSDDVSPPIITAAPA